MATIGPVDLRVDVQGAQATVHVMYDINFSARPADELGLLGGGMPLIGDDPDVGDPAAAGGDDTLGFLTPLFNDHTAPEGGKPTLSRHFMKTSAKATSTRTGAGSPTPTRSAPA